MKKLRNAMVAICLMICALALTACGGGQLSTEASVSKKGYVATTKEEYTAFSEQIAGEDSTDMNAYKMTMKMKGSTEVAGLKTEVDMLINTIVTVNAEGAVNGMATKVSSGKLKMELYLVDGYQYLYYKNDKEEYKYKVAIPAEELAETMTGASTIGDEILSMIGECMSNITVNEVLTDKVSYKKAVKGDVTRFNVNLADEKATLDFYVENTNAKTTGAELDITTKEATMKLALTKFTGNIKYPSFKKYQDATEEIVTGLSDSATTVMETVMTAIGFIFAGISA